MNLVSVDFSVECPVTQIGESVYVVGDREELGAWQPQRALRLSSDARTFPLWESPSVPVSEGAPIEFKFILVDATGMRTRWEAFAGNRILELDSGSVMSVRARWDDVAMTVCSARSVPARITAPSPDIPSSRRHHGRREPELCRQVTRGLLDGADVDLQADVCPEWTPSALPALDTPTSVCAADRAQSVDASESPGMVQQRVNEKERGKVVPSPSSLLSTRASSAGNMDGLTLEDEGVGHVADGPARPAGVASRLGMVAESLATSLQERSKDPASRAGAITAAGGAVVLGTGGAAVGLVGGGAAGAVIGVVPAVVTLGFSIPVLAALGSGCGALVGSVVGTSSGLLAGALVGYGSYKTLTDPGAPAKKVP